MTAPRTTPQTTASPTTAPQRTPPPAGRAGSDAGGARLRVVLAMDRRTRTDLLPPATASRLLAVADTDVDELVHDWADPRHADRLMAADVLLTGWGVPEIDASALARMPVLRAVVHGAGSVKAFANRCLFDRGVLVSSAAAANAVPVAQFTVAAVVFAAKRVTRFADAFRRDRSGNALTLPVSGVGAHGLTVGVVGASHIGRLVIPSLLQLDMHVLLHDPTIGPATAKGMGVEPVDLDELLRRSDVVTLHAPSLPATQQLIDRRRLSLLRDGATLINTARGSLVDTDALTAELVTGRIDAVLDVTDPEPLPAGSPLFELPNVLLTPHIAGALGNEVVRLGELAVSEIERLAAGVPLAHPVRATDLERIA